MHIPLLGHLFKTEKKQTVRDELLVFITPRIMQEE
jgi:type II secretory pathway component HofQ